MKKSSHPKKKKNPSKKIALARIRAAIGRGLSDESKVDVPAVDDAIPLLKPLACWPFAIKQEITICDGQHVLDITLCDDKNAPLVPRNDPQHWRKAARFLFLQALDYFMQEQENAHKVSSQLKKPVHKAIEHIEKAATLLAATGNSDLVTLLWSIAEEIEEARFGIVTPRRLYDGYVFSPEQRRQIEKLTNKGTEQALALCYDIIPAKGIRLGTSITHYVATGRFSAKRGEPSRAANIIKAIADFFPNDKAFLAEHCLYAKIAMLAELCGLKNLDQNEYVRSVLAAQK